MKKLYVIRLGIFVWLGIALIGIRPVAADLAPPPDLSETEITSAGVVLPPSGNPRLSTLLPEDQKKFDTLPTEQKVLIQNGQVRPGFTDWMAKLALGDPYYLTEHQSDFPGYEQVWLYTKTETTTETKDNPNTIDPKTNTPADHRRTTTKTCQTGDFFLLFFKGTLKKIVDDNSNKPYGSCVLDIRDEYSALPKTGPQDSEKD